MKNKILALAVVGVMLSVCFAGVFSYTDDTDAIAGNGTANTPYELNDKSNPEKLSKLKDKAVVYFNLSYDEQYTNEVTTKASVKTLEGADSNVITASDPVQDTTYHFSSDLIAENFETAVSLKVTYTVTIDYTDTTSDDVVYYVVYVNVLTPNVEPSKVTVEFKGNVDYTTENSPVIVSVINSNNSYYSNNLPAGLYLKTAENGDAKVVGMIGSGAPKTGTFDIYQITDRDVVKTPVSYTVADADGGNGFNYSVSVVDNSTGNPTDNPILNKISDENKTIVVKSGTVLNITTSEKLTQFKAVNQINGEAYGEIKSESNTYVLSDNVSGTVKVFMTYNNGINDNCTKTLTIIYIGSTADASLSNPVVRSY